jgi:CBS domain-containing protein
MLTVEAFLEWIAKGDGNSEQSVAALLDASPMAVSPETSVAEGTLIMSSGISDALAITSDGSPHSSLEAVVTIRNLGQAFGDHPVDILREIAHARDPRALRDLNHRARQFTLRFLNDASSTDWLTRFTSTADIAIVKRLIAIVAPEHIHRRWCFCGPSGRGEALPRLSPEIVLIDDADRYAAVLRLVSEQLEECGYLPSAERPFEPSFYVASIDEWKKRYLGWVGDPILKQIYNAYPFFDLRPILGIDDVWREFEAAVLRAVNREFLHVVSNDCLTNLPPLTFFQNMVLDEAGEETHVFRLEETALRPLVYVGRVFGLATRKAFSTSTLERYALAQHSWPANATIFREASEALRIVLWQQGRVGIRDETGGAVLPPALLGAYDRQLLKSCFRSITRLLEFTGELEWLKAL